MKEIDNLLECLRNSNNVIKEDVKQVAINHNFTSDNVTDLKSLYEYLEINNITLPYQKPKSDFEKYLNACVSIPQIVKIYNEGAVLDWNDTNEYKYLPYFKKVGFRLVCDFAYGFGNSSAGSFGHHYKSIELCDLAVKNFNQIYIDFYSYQG